ncbi:MAG: PrsW family intramembrane metalloprotease [Candidatus Limnocylindrales bacterium]
MSALVVQAPPRVPRWGLKGTFVKPQQPAFWLFVALFFVGGDKSLGIQLSLAELPTSFLLSWVLVLLYAVPVAFLIYRLDLFEREPKALLAAALIWGGVIATGLAIYANEAWGSVVGKVAPDIALDWGAAIVAPPVEETLKLMGVVLLFLIVPEEFDGPLDGFVYGAMVGLGFTAVEDTMYFLMPVFASGVDQTGPVIDTFFIRVIGGGLYGHVLFAGLTGMGFAYFATSRAALSRRIAGFGGCFAAAFLAHAFWDAPLLDDVLANGGAAPTQTQILLWCTLKGLPFLILLGVLVVVATRSEERSFRAIVAGEPDGSLFPEPELRALGSLWTRRSARAEAGRRLGPAGARLMGELQSAQIDYAMVRSRSKSVADPALERLRQRIRWIRARMVPISGAPAAASLPGAPAAATLPGVAAAAAPAWSPTHLAPAGGMAAWAVPDPSQPPVASLPPGLELVVEWRIDDWALVRALSGWRGWVDGRLLVERR